MAVGGQHHAPAVLPPEKPRYPFYTRSGGPQGRSGRVRKMSPPPGFDSRTVHPVVSCYIGWAIPAHNTAFKSNVSYVYPQCQHPPPPQSLSQTISLVTDRGSSNVEVLDSNLPPIPRGPAVLSEVSMVFLSSYRIDPHIIPWPPSATHLPIRYSLITPSFEAIPTLSLLPISLNDS
jgi:hypothetical protein